jgi:uncharacterized protein (DUF885 family)
VITLATTYVPAAAAKTGASQLPNGDEYYAWSLQRYNTTRMTAREIHDLGLREVARIDAAMRDVMREAGFNGIASRIPVLPANGQAVPV